jgi:arginase family enzyme
MKSRQLDSSKSPRFAQPATFMRLPHQTDLTGVDVAMVGVPFDSGTSYRRAAARHHGPLALIQFDAHIDTWGDYFGGKYFHGSPFRRAIEERLIDPARYVQIGIRGPMYGEDADFTYQRELGVTTIDIGMVKRDGVEATMARAREIVGAGPLYVTFDIDSVDPAFAPGTGTPEVGGLTSYEAQDLVRRLAGLNMIACDVVEVAPQFDGPGQITALLAANILFELLCVRALRA